MPGIELVVVDVAEPQEPALMFVVVATEQPRQLDDGTHVVPGIKQGFGAEGSAGESTETSAIEMGLEPAPGGDFGHWFTTRREDLKAVFRARAEEVLAHWTDRRSLAIGESMAESQNN